MFFARGIGKPWRIVNSGGFRSTAKIIAQRVYTHRHTTSAGFVLQMFTVDVYYESEQFIIHAYIRSAGGIRGDYVVAHKESGVAMCGFKTLRRAKEYIKATEALDLPWDTIHTMQDLQMHITALNGVRKQYQ